VICKQRCSHLLGLESVEVLDLEVLDERVELLGGVLILVSLASDADTDLAWHVSDSVHPDGLVEAGVDFHFLKQRWRVRFQLKDV